jgi:hypothetical protein
MFLWLVVALIEIVITRERTPHSFFTFIPPLAYFISHYLLLIRRKRIAEIMLWVFTIGIFTVSWTAQTGRFEKIGYAELFAKSSLEEDTIKNQQILVLNEDFGIYKKNKLATPFLNWNLSKEVFERPDYFENIALIEKSFQKETPDVIIDKNDLMKPIFERIPRLKALYKKEGGLYRKIK